MNTFSWKAIKRNRIKTDDINDLVDEYYNEYMKKKYNLKSLDDLIDESGILLKPGGFDYLTKEIGQRKIHHFLSLLKAYNLTNKRRLKRCIDTKEFHKELVENLLPETLKFLKYALKKKGFILTIDIVELSDIEAIKSILQKVPEYVYTGEQKKMRKSVIDGFKKRQKKREKNKDNGQDSLERLFSDISEKEKNELNRVIDNGSEVIRLEVELKIESV